MAAGASFGYCGFLTQDFYLYFIQNPQEGFHNERIEMLAGLIFVGIYGCAP